MHGPTDSPRRLGVFGTFLILCGFDARSRRASGHRYFAGLRWVASCIVTKAENK